jgi:ribosome-associated protein
MRLSALRKIVVEALDEKKAKDVQVLDVRNLTSMFDSVIIATGDSTRQNKALARGVHDKVKEKGGSVYGIEGTEVGEWVLVDLGDIVVHIMQPTVRLHYNLEELWAVKKSPRKRTTLKTDSAKASKGA